MKNGPYELVVAPEDYHGKRYRGRYVYEHVLAWWQNTGTLPPNGFVVHHKNEMKRDNRFSNLELKRREAHSAEHSKRPKEQVTCAECGGVFLARPSDVRRRRSASKSGEITCSPDCARKRKRGPRELEHGYGRYRQGCRCSICRDANNARMVLYRSFRSTFKVEGTGC